MSSPKSMILVLAPSGADAADLVEPLTTAGFAAECHLIPTSGSGNWVRVRPAVVVVLVPSAPELAAAFTRRLRADTTSSPLPVLWVLTADTLTAATDGLDAGADACLVYPVDGALLVAQVHALLRTHRTLTRFAAKGADTSDLTERLQKLYRTAETDAVLARQALAAFRPRGLVLAGDLVASWYHRPAVRGGGMFDVRGAADGIRFVLVEVGGLGIAVGAMVATCIVQLILRELTDSPKATLTVAHQRLMELTLPETAVVSAMAGMGSAETGRVTVACAGLPSPVLVSADGPASVWHGSGPFLGTTGAEFHDISGELKPGEKVVLMAGSAVADRRPDVRAAAETHRALTTQPFADAVANELLADADPDDGFTLMVVDRTAET